MSAYTALPLQKRGPLLSRKICDVPSGPATIRPLIAQASLTRLAVAGGLLSVVAVTSCSAATPQGVPRDSGSGIHDGAVSDPRAAICAQVDASGEVSYSVVQQIFDRQCVTCHSPGADLILQDNVSWGNLVNHPAPPAESCGGTLVVPGNPAASYLFQKLSSSSPCSGLQMPRGELGSEPLPACVVNLISTWILDGAPGPTGGG